MRGRLELRTQTPKQIENPTRTIGKRIKATKRTSVQAFVSFSDDPICVRLEAHPGPTRNERHLEGPPGATDPGGQARFHWVFETAAFRSLPHLQGYKLGYGSGYKALSRVISGVTQGPKYVQIGARSTQKLYLLRPLTTPRIARLRALYPDL